jgi:hypothetical protein
VPNYLRDVGSVHEPGSLDLPLRVLPPIRSVRSATHLQLVWGGAHRQGAQLLRLPELLPQRDLLLLCVFMLLCMPVLLPVFVPMLRRRGSGMGSAG